MNRNFNLRILRNVQGSTHPNDIAGAIRTINDIENYINYLEKENRELKNQIKKLMKEADKHE